MHEDVYVYLVGVGVLRTLINYYLIAFVGFVLYITLLMLLLLDWWRNVWSAWASGILKISLLLLLLLL